MQEYTPRLKDYIDTIFTARKWIALVTLASALTAVIAILVLPKIYEAGTVVYLRLPFVRTSLQPESIAIMESNQPQLSRFGTHIERVNCSLKAWEEIAKGQDTMKEVIDRLKLKKITMEELRRMLKVRIVVESRTYSYIFNAPILEFRTKFKRDPVLAANVVNTWTDIFVEKFNTFYFSQLEEMHKYAIKQYQDSEKKLNTTEAAYLQFKISPGAQKDSFEYKFKEAAMERESRDANETYELFRQKAEYSRITLDERIIKAFLVSKAMPPQESTVEQHLVRIIASAGAFGFLISVFFTIVLLPMSKISK